MWANHKHENLLPLQSADRWSSLGREDKTPESSAGDETGIWIGGISITILKNCTHPRELEQHLYCPRFFQNIEMPKKICPYLNTKHESIIVNPFISKGSERDYQLWVNSGKEEAPYPLIGKFLRNLR